MAYSAKNTRESMTDVITKNLTAVQIFAVMAEATLVILPLELS